MAKVSKAECLLTGLSPEQREAFQKEFRKSEKLIILLKQILDNRIGTFARVDINDTNWSQKRAYYDGRVSEIEYLIKLFTVTE